MQTIVAGLYADPTYDAGDFWVRARRDMQIKIPQLTDSNGVDLTSFLV